ncbi:MAG: threonine-phosphate decarboxylase CobD [Cyanobacteria bacterium J06554_11]
MDRPVHGGNLAWAAGLARCSPRELLDFSASISPLGPPASVQQAVQAAFSCVVNYPDTAYTSLREAIAFHHSISAACVLPGNGAADLLTWAARDLAALPGPTFQLTPGFSDYARALSAFEGNWVEIPLLRSGGWQFEKWDADLPTGSIPTDQSLDQCGLLLNNPHNPTGMLFAKEQVRSLLSKFAWVVVDEAFMDFLPPEQAQSVIDLVAYFPNLVVLRSLTKFYSMPGIRLGYAIAQPAVLKRWNRWRDPWSVNTFASAAGVAALQDTAFQKQTWQWLAAENAYLYQGLSKLPGLKPLTSCVNFFLASCQVSATTLQRQLLQRHKIYIRDCMSFAQLGDRYFRVAVKSREHNQRLLAALADTLPQLIEVAHAS